jgi:hypothetical protein
VSDDLVDPQAHRLATHLTGQLDAYVTEDLDLGVLPQRLGIDEQAIEVEDGRLEVTLYRTNSI